MKLLAAIPLAIIYLHTSSALNITYPIAGSRVDRSQPWNVTWTLDANDPLANASVDIILSGQAALGGNLQYVGTDVPIAPLSYEVPANNVSAGVGSLIINTIGAQSNAFRSDVAGVIFLPGANASQTANASAAATSTSSAGADGLVQAGDPGVLMTWLATLGMSLFL